MAKEENIILPVLAGVALLALFSTNSKNGPAPSPPPVPGITPTNFIKKYWSEALQSQAQTKVPALVTITQAGLESGWGKHAPGNNFFGIKSGSAWSGQKQKLLTWECGPSGNASQDKITDEVVYVLPPGDPKGICGPDDLQSLYKWHSYRDKFKLPGENIYFISGNKYSYRVRAWFRAYPDARASFTDHGMFLQNNSRYKNAFNYTKDPAQFAREIAKAGYATDPNYASKLISSMYIAQDVLKRAGMI